MVSWCFQGEEKGCIGNILANYTDVELKIHQYNLVIMLIKVTLKLEKIMTAWKWIMIASYKIRTVTYTSPLLPKGLNVLIKKLKSK